MTDFVFDEVPRRIEAYKQSIASKSKLDVTFAYAPLVDGDVTYIYVNTNLPDETLLHFEMYRSGIKVECVSAVKNGVARSEGLTDNGEKLTGGFILNITMLDGWEQPKSVSDVTGLFGELLSGEHLMYNKRRTTVEFRTMLQL